MAKATPTQEELKSLAGYSAASEVADGMVVGLGTGSTVRYTVLRLGERVRKEGLSILGIPTSKATEALAKEQGITLTTLGEHPEVDITIDGADEVDPEFDLVKGGGGALTREKIVAASSLRLVIVVDRSKLVPRLAATFPLPVEVVPMGYPLLERKAKALAATPRRREHEGKPVVTDNGNWISDVSFAPDGIDDKERVERILNLTPGVVENGLFLGMTSRVVVGTEDGPRVLKKGEWLSSR